MGEVRKRKKSSDSLREPDGCSGGDQNQCG